MGFDRIHELVGAYIYSKVYHIIVLCSEKRDKYIFPDIMQISFHSPYDAFSCARYFTGFKEGLKDALSGVIRATSIVKGFRNYARKSPQKIAKEVNVKIVANRIVSLLS